MTISSVTSSVPSQTPVVPPDTNQQNPPQVNANSDNDDNSNAQTARAPLPPGQGTRVDQLA